MTNTRKSLQVHIEPEAPGHYSLVAKTVTTRTAEGVKIVETITPVPDIFQAKSIPIALTRIFEQFAQTIKAEPPADLFAPDEATPTKT